MIDELKAAGAFWILLLMAVFAAMLGEAEISIQSSIAALIVFGLAPARGKPDA